MEGGRHFFNTVKEGDSVLFATDDEAERTLWVQAIYRATGQSHKPVPPVAQANKISNTQLSRMQGGRRSSFNFQVWQNKMNNYLQGYKFSDLSLIPDVFTFTPLKIIFENSSLENVSHGFIIDSNFQKKLYNFRFIHSEPDLRPCFYT